MNVQISREYREISFTEVFKRNNSTLVGSSEKYKYVRIYEYKDGTIFYQAYQPKSKGNRAWNKCFMNEREAALSVDKKRIERGFEPLNILVKK